MELMYATYRRPEPATTTCACKAVRWLRRRCR